MACAPCPVCPSPSIPEALSVASREWLVVRAKDGDTLVVKQAQPERTETVRLLRVNTPEVGERGHDEATEALKALVRAGRVELEHEHPNEEKRDGFGRLLVYVIADGVNVNLELVRQGWSPFYKKYGKGRLAAEFEAAEQEAREAVRGLWATPP
jgi:micrococcal nuclease